jgi:hypothetical protein
MCNVRLDGFFPRLRAWGTTEKVNQLVDLLFKLTAIVAALATANFFFFRPNVQLKIGCGCQKVDRAC